MGNKVWFIDLKCLLRQPWYYEGLLTFYSAGNHSLDKIALQG